ncbi:PepSY-associated TM helix domain-containing protein [Marinicauda algicola]|uniref:PepSY-associated TM helix domain-containing protein n=1 Tax=Marinicauda algicola TaxID=2029849 RepID=UPI0013050753|nr:PepSY-associated TM helix domain-containing protein [Marinicauda algicola]
MVDAIRSGPQTRPAARAKAKKKTRSLWWQVHQWAGLQISLFLSFVFVTGTLAVLSYEMDWLARPAMWAAPTPAEERVSWGRVGAAVEDHLPGAEILNLYAPLHPASTFDVIVSHEGATKHVYVHPRTGQVTGTGPWAGFQRFLRNTHRHLMIPVKWGVSIVSISAVFLLVSLVTSFWVYKKWWRGFLRWPEGRTARALTGDVHRVMGVWSIWFIVLMIVTGLWYFVEQWGGAAPAANAPRTEIAGEAPQVFDRPGDALDAGIAALRDQIPGYRVDTVRWLPGGQPVFEVHGTTDRAILVRPRANAAWIDARTGALLETVDPSTLSVHTRIAEAADPLHFGTFGGYWTKTLWFVFGAGLSALSLTGVAIYALRIAKAGREEPGWGSGLMRAWRAMGPARWPALALCLLPFVMAPFVL